MTRTVTVDHLARVEGHGAIKVELDGRRVNVVRFDIFEGSRMIETLVQGRRFEDVPPIVSRVCAICSVSHSLASLLAAERAFGVTVSRQTESLRNLMHCGEMIASHALHLFLLVAPDYLNQPSAVALVSANPELVQLGLRLKKLGNLIQETVGGRAIHPVAAVPGGFAALPAIDAIIALKHALQAGVADCESAIDAFASFPAADFCRSSTVFAALRDGAMIVMSHGAEVRIVPDDYRALTSERAELFSNAKHSLFRGEPFMVGALARLTIGKDSLSARAMWAVEKLGLRLPSDNPADNNKAQVVELLLEVEEALRIVENILFQKGLRPERPLPVTPCEGTGTAVIEAPRGLLIHSYTFDSGGSVVAADVVTPTAMNAASIERHFRAVAEQTPDHTDLTHRLEMLARAYDPCISCSVHVVQECHVD
jgi:sulfhydrogenase subunit alpha